jgi:hypothetical protein
MTLFLSYVNAKEYWSVSLIEKDGKVYNFEDTSSILRICSVLFKNLVEKYNGRISEEGYIYFRDKKDCEKFINFINDFIKNDYFIRKGLELYETQELIDEINERLEKKNRKQGD